MNTHTKNIALVISGLLTGLLMATGLSVFADGDPTTDNVQRALPYQGVLELDGQPIHAVGPQALWMEFALYDGLESPDPVYIQQIQVEVYAGRFTVSIGPFDDGGTPIEEVITAADDLMLGMTLLNDRDDEADDVAMANRQRIHASPYALWTTSATNLTVANNLNVGGDIDLGGGELLNTTEIEMLNGAINGVNIINAQGGETRVGGSLAISGADMRLGLSDGQSIGSRTTQRALQHSSSDTLVVNPNTDFEGGTRVDGNLTVTGSLNGQTVVPNYHITHTQQGYTTELDMERINTLCGDADGCSVRLGMRRWNSNNDTAAASRVYIMYYNASDRRWRLSNDAFGGIGDGVRQHAINIWSTCYLTDGLYTNYADRGDNGVGFKLLLWNGYRGANRSCELTFVD
ncbi:MAG: hypothetical protein AAFS10_24420 [Myxococcota bacterium]